MNDAELGRSKLTHRIFAFVVALIAALSLGGFHSIAYAMDNGGIVGEVGDQLKWYPTEESVLEEQPDFNNRAIYGVKYEAGQPIDPLGPNQFIRKPIVTINGNVTYGWCIDPDTHFPSGDPASYVFEPGLGFEDNPDGFVQNFRDKLYSEPGKLDRVVNLEYDRAVAERSASFEVPFEGNIRNSAIHVAKLLGEAWDNQNHQDMIDYSTALAMLLNSWRVSEGGTASGGATGFSQAVIDSWNELIPLPVYHRGIPGVQKNQITTLTPKKFEEITGYRYKKPSLFGTPSYLRNAVLFEWVGDGRIPEAAPDEYLTVAAPLIYNPNADQNNQYQRVLVGHQPGIPNWPGNEPKLNAFTPEVKTKAEWADTEGDIVTDTVSVSGLVENGEYVLTGQLVSKAEGNAVLGTSEAKTFTANKQDLADFAVAEDGSVSGTITVEVPGASKIEAGQSAVVFETLTSSTVDKQGNPLDEGSDPATIAEHKDLNDAAQTVTRPVPPNAFTPEVKTKAEWADTEGDIVTDTVSVSGLVENGEYVLTGQLVSKAEGNDVLGESEAKAFTANKQDLADFAVAEDGSVSGTITVEVPGASKIKAGQSAVVFETLTSSTVDKQGNPLDEGSDPATIAEHKDLNDAAQTVTRPKPEPVPTPSPKDEETKTPKPGPSDTPKNVVASAPAPEKEVDELSLTGSAIGGLIGVSVLALAAGVGALLLRNRSKKIM